MKKRNVALLAFGMNVRKKREILGLSQEALAERASLDRTYISGIERGKRNPTLLSSLSIARALGMKLVDLFREIELE